MLPIVSPKRVNIIVPEETKEPKRKTENRFELHYYVFNIARSSDTVNLRTDFVLQTKTKICQISTIDFNI